MCGSTETHNEYGYIFRWRSGGALGKIQKRRLEEGLDASFPKLFLKLSVWAQKNPFLDDNDYFCRVLLFSLAVYTLDMESNTTQVFHKGEFVKLFSTFIPEADIPEVPAFLTKLADDYKKGVPALAGLLEYRKAFSPVIS